MPGPKHSSALNSDLTVSLNVTVSLADWGAFVRFNETTSDNENYDIDSERLKRLAQIGLISHRGRGRYCTTDLGRALVDQLAL